MNGGRFDFDDGGTYCGGWEEGKAHGHGVCTGPQGKGEYAGAWHYGFEVSGVYTWPSGNTYQGQWQNGKRHGLGVEQRGRWIYKGEWTQGYKGRYGHRLSMTSQAKYQGTWSAGFHDGYGTETYVDGGSYQGQWLRGMRHGYGIRKSAQHGVAAKFRSRSRTNASLTSLRSEYGEGEEKEKKNYDETNESRGGFVLKACSKAPTRRRSLSERSLAVKRTILSGLRIKKQHSTGDIHQHVTTGSLRSSGSTVSCTSDESEHRQGRENLIVSQEDQIEPNTTEVYKGEWKNDKRCGFGIGERSDGLKYEGEWFNNRKCGYGITTFKDGRKEEGKYKNNVLVCSNRKKGLLFVRSSRLKERVGNAVEAANRAATIAQQKADIAVSRTATAKERSEQADYIALQAREDADTARMCAKQFAPEFRQPGTEAIRVQMNCLQQQHSAGTTTSANHVSFDSPPTSKSSHESRDLSDELIILNPPSLPLATPEITYTPSQQSQTPGGTIYQPQQVMVNLGSYQQGIMTNSDADYIPSSLQQHHQSSNPGGYQSSSGFQTNSVASIYQQQQQQHSVNSVGYAGSQQTSIFGPTSYQVLPSVSSSHKVAGGYQPSTQLPVISSTALPGVQLPYISSSSSYRPNAVPHHNFSVTHQYQQKQQQHQNILASYPGTGFAIPEQRSFIFHSDITSLEQSNNTTSNITGELQQRQFTNGTTDPCSIENISPASSRSLLQNTNAAQSSSRMSLSDDHYDQYMMFANTSRSGLIHRNRPSLTRQPFAVHDISQNLYRRSTLATASDKRLEDVVRRRRGGDDDDEFEEVEGRGSLPNLVELEVSGVHLRREEAARLASQQRQELQRLLEEEQLLRSNPLRYLFHPTFRAWIIRWKMPLVLSMANIFLLMVFYNLLTYEKRTRERR
ncbi:junctophilin [Loa loa]|uniref:Junctophilin n=1 Tax=Loa loa TaxID=7209 RepID=A0A1S0UKM3_LOALO|nr:junctophilin [Loa loa]EJD76031.1 junctophilin [Loa loa]